MTAPDLSGARWRKSSRSLANGECVEIANVGAVRDSKDPDGPVLFVDVPALIAAIKDGRLNPDGTAL